MIRQKTAPDLLAEALRREAAPREAQIVNFMRWITPVTGVMALTLWPVLGEAHSLLLAAVLFPLSLYYNVQAWALRRGLFRPWLQWLNVAIESSAPCALYLLDLHFKGPVYALTAPPVIIWSTLILLSALRSNRLLALLSGSLAASEYLILYFVFTLPRLGADPLPTLSPPLILIRVFLLFSAGLLTAILANHLVQLTSRTLRALREEDVMGKYQLEELIGKGGMAEVYRALYCPEGGFRKAVALKRIHSAYSDDPSFVRMFQREAYLGSLLNHPNVVQVHDAGRHQGRYFLAMEYVDGLSLAAALALNDQPLSLAALTFLGAELGEALGYIHQRVGAEGRPLGLVHRDVNPPNILISRQGDVKLADFGIARTFEAGEHTAAGSVVGKLRFLSPEQLLGQPVDARADLFALGLTLHLALTGRSPFGGSTESAIARAILEAEVLSPSRLRPDVPPELDVALQQLLRRDPAHRTRSGQELRERLCLVRGVGAPYPHGKAELAAFVQLALARKQGSSKLETPPVPLSPPVANGGVTEEVTGLTVGGRPKH